MGPEDGRQGKVHHGDCIEWLASQPEGFAELVFADPPFNIGYQYDVYEDTRAYEDYYDWTRRWMAACVRALTPTGTLWVAIGDEYAAEVRLIGRELGLTLRNWVIWHYTFGQNTKRKFARSHAQLFYFVRDPVEFTFDDRAVRTFSDRQRTYSDKRANPRGKLPDDTWHEFPRVCGTFGEREGWHPCQMPEQLLARIVRCSSNVGDMVFDPFAGSGTTLVAAKRNGRRFAGTEFSQDYTKNVQRRLEEVRPLSKAGPDPTGVWSDEHRQELRWCFGETSVPSTQLAKSRAMLEVFVGLFNARLNSGGYEGTYRPEEVWRELETLRRDSQLPMIRPVSRETDIKPTRRPCPGTNEPAARPGRRERRKADADKGLFAGES